MEREFPGKVIFICLPCIAIRGSDIGTFYSFGAAIIGIDTAHPLHSNVNDLKQNAADPPGHVDRRAPFLLKIQKFVAWQISPIPNAIFPIVKQVRVYRWINFW